MAFTIRTPETHEMAQIGRLAGALVRLHHRLDADRFMLHEPLEDGYARFLASMLEDPKAVVLGAFDDDLGRAVGYAYGRVEARDWNRLLDRHAKLHDIYVEEAARRRGVARQLAQATFDRLKALGATRIVLDTAHANEPARAFFASMGFRPTMVEMLRIDGER